MGDRLNRPPVVGPTGTLPRHACRLVTLRLPGGELWKKALHRLLPGGEEPRVAGREKETGWGGQVSEERRAPVPSPGTPPESAFPSELPSLRARGLARAPRSGASATALAAASDGSRTTSDNYGQYGHLGDFRRVDFLPNGCSPFRHGNDFGRSMPAHLKAARGRWSGSTLAGRRAEWIALASLHGGVFTRSQLSAMASVRPLQGAATQRGIALEKQVRRQTGRGSMRRGRTWRTRGPRWSAGRVSASRRPMRRDEPERPRRRTRLSDALIAGEPAYPLGPRFAGPRQGLAGGCAPSDPPNGTGT